MFRIGGPQYAYLAGIIIFFLTISLLLAPSETIRGWREYWGVHVLRIAAKRFDGVVFLASIGIFLALTLAAIVTFFFRLMWFTWIIVAWSWMIQVLGAELAITMVYWSMRDFFSPTLTSQRPLPARFPRVIFVRRKP